MFAPVPSSPRFPKLEESILDFWKSERIYEESLRARQGAKPFVFYEGPPTANGMPHPGHCLTRAIKDLFPRYKTMRGYECRRKAGWDTHGLPVEVEVCKELGIHSKEEIEAYGVEPFIKKCRESVWRYMQEWEKLTERLGFWVDLDEAYVTYHQTFVESVWWSLKQLFDRGLLYQGHKIVWWWAQGGTALSSGEVGQGYRQVADPSVFVRFPLVEDPTVSLLVWTTTPWTLPSNQFAAVRGDLDYVVARDPEDGSRLILAAELLCPLQEKLKRNFDVERTLKGTELVGKRYVPPFDYYYKSEGDAVGTLKTGGEEPVAWRVVDAEFVTTDSGSGIVHLAPAFGEVDFDVLTRDRDRFASGGPDLICAVGPDGKFTDVAGPYAGRWVKDADKDILHELKERGLRFFQEQYLHDYPFCWRADQDPLIQYPRRSWFVRTTAFREKMLENNRQIGWLPEHIRDGRFGNFLESNVDWALSRERYWGTPLPIWVCSETGQMEAVASYDELLAKPGVSGQEVWEQAKAADPDLADDLKVHKPYIDAVEYDSPFAKGARMQRVGEVIDCWYDSGAMPFAQWGFPHTGHADFASQFPADFISEALDQTRGWFYSLLAISTMLFGESPEGVPPATGDARVEANTPFPHPFRNCIVLGLMLAEWYESKDGKQTFLSEDEAREKTGGKYVQKTGKMSKRLRNYRSPQEIFDAHGADALRWYFYSAQPPWNSIVYSERAIKESVPEFLLRLWHCFSFFVTYARLDGFDPAAEIAGDSGSLEPASLAKAKSYVDPKQRSEVDRWVLGELDKTIRTVTERMDAYDNFGACRALNDFVDGLSNWYVRRSRDRFWSSAADPANAGDKAAAYWTLFECLATTCRLIAPFTPFVAESMWRNLVAGFEGRAKRSVHLCDYPNGASGGFDATLSDRMALVRELASLGRSARSAEKLKVRQPLARVEVALAQPTHLDWLRQHDAVLEDELNVKRVEYVQDAASYVDYKVVPNFRVLGPKLGKLLPAAKKALGEADGGELNRQLQSAGKISLTLDGQTVTFEPEELEIRLNAKAGWAAAQSPRAVVVLATELTPELVREGLARDLVRLIQDRRKELDLDYSDRIRVGLVAESEDLTKAVAENADYIRGETLAEELVAGPIAGAEALERSIGETQVTLFVERVAGQNSATAAGAGDLAAR